MLAGASADSPDSPSTAPLAREVRPQAFRVWLAGVVVVLAANAAFLAFNIAGSAAPVEPLIERVQTAFATGALRPHDWDGLDRWRGMNQYNDCMILLFALDRSAPVLVRATGPTLVARDTTWSGYCKTLSEVAHDDPVTADYIRLPYARYWHGYLPLSVALLQFLEWHQVRGALKMGVYGSLLLLLFAAATARRPLALAAVPIAVTGLLFWGVPYYGQSPSHGPGDAIVVLGIACLLLWRERLSREDVLALFCAAYGAAVVYLDFLTGLLPTAAGLLIPTAYVIVASRAGPPCAPRDAWRAAAVAALAFTAGAGLTVLIKQAFAVAFIGWEAIAAFADQFRLWTGLSAPPSSISPPEDRLLGPLLTVLRKGGAILTYGSKPGALALFAASALAWIAAGWLALRSRDRGRLSAYLAFAAGAAVIPAWIVVFSAHTAVHTFMVRMFIVPIALGWAALAWQVWSAPPVEGSAAHAIRSHGK